MKKKAPVPTATTADADAVRRTPSNQTIQMRMTAEEKKGIQAAAKSVNRTVTDYLLQCHAVIAAKLKG